MFETMIQHVFVDGTVTLGDIRRMVQAGLAPVFMPVGLDMPSEETLEWRAAVFSLCDAILALPDGAGDMAHFADEFAVPAFADVDSLLTACNPPCGVFCAIVEPHAKNGKFACFVAPNRNAVQAGIDEVTKVLSTRPDLPAARLQFYAFPMRGHVEVSSEAVAATWEAFTEDERRSHLLLARFVGRPGGGFD